MSSAQWTLTPFLQLQNATPEAPLGVNLVRVLGTHLSRHSFLHSLTENVFNATTVEKVLEQVKKTAVQLQRTDVFQDIQMYMDTKDQEAVDLTLLLKEKDKGYMKSNVNVGDNQAELSVGLGLRNVFGGGENVYSSFSYGNRTSAAAETIAETFVPGCTNIKAGILVNGSIRDHSQINAFEEATRSVGVHLKGWSKLGEHQVGYSIAERDIVAFYDASNTVRAQSGSHFKHSIYHKFVRDERNDTLLPTDGHYISFVQEVAGLKNQGDISYVKHEMNASYHQPLNKYMSLSTSVRVGLLNRMSRECSILDRFYLGGPLSVRGFAMGGIGEKDQKDSMGGEGYYAAGISLISAIPSLEHIPVKIHAFANGGNIVTRASSVDELAKTPRVSVGLGVILHHSIARIEANYCIPLRYSTSDSIEPKFQFGFGLDFL